MKIFSTPISLPPLLACLLPLSLCLAVPASAAGKEDGLPLYRAEAHAVPLAYTAEAVVEAVRQATVAAQVSGRVLEVRFDAGKRVRKGEVLMRLDNREASENAVAAQAQLANAQVSYQRSQRLLAQNFVSQAALDRAKSDFDAAQAAAAGSRAGASHAVVSAPMNGIVAARLTEQGELATPGKPLFTVYDPSELRVTAQVPQGELARLKEARRARIEFKETGRIVESTDIQVLPTVDAVTHTATVRVTLPAGVAEAVPGGFVRLHFVSGNAVRLTVPPGAVLKRGEVTAVYVLNAAGLPTLRQLRLGSTLGDGSREVLAGLSVGEQVVTDPVRAAIALKQGSR